MSNDAPNRTGLNKFYLDQYPTNPARQPVWADVGNLLKISGVLVQGMGVNLILMLPSGNVASFAQPPEMRRPGLEEWSEFIRRTDDPEQFALDADGFTKILQRKAASAISGAVQQSVWARDNFECVFCGRRMGDPYTVLSIDHWVPLELGGKNDTSNYLTACTRCNKDKGSLPPETYCRQKGLDFKALEAYLRRVSGVA